MTTNLDQATTRAFNRLELAGGNLAAAFDRLAIGVRSEDVLERLVEAADAPRDDVVLSAMIVAVEADRLQRRFLSKHANAMAKSDAQWRRDVNPDQLPLDGIYPARYVAGHTPGHHRQLRVALWARAGGRCEDCGRDGSKLALDMHHLSYEHYGSELESEVLLICRRCHDLRHDDLRIPV
jgi:hypothetical protein